MGRAARKFCMMLVCIAGLSASASSAAAQDGARSNSAVALEPMRTSNVVRVLRYVVAGVLIVAALGWAGRARARREGE